MINSLLLPVITRINTKMPFHSPDNWELVITMIEAIILWQGRLTRRIIPNYRILVKEMLFWLVLMTTCARHARIPLTSSSADHHDHIHIENPLSVHVCLMTVLFSLKLFSTCFTVKSASYAFDHTSSCSNVFDHPRWVMNLYWVISHREVIQINQLHPSI